MRTRAIAALLCVVGCAPVAAERFDFRMPMEQRQSGVFYVTATLADDVEADFLVDTGSSLVMVTSKTFARLRRQAGTRYARAIRGSMANGRVQQVRIYRVARLTLSAGCVLNDIEVAVMPGASENILGLNALRQVAPFALETSPPGLLLSDCHGLDAAHARASADAAR